MTDRPIPKKKAWMRPADAAKVLGVTRHTVIARALKGEFRSMQVAGLTFVSRKDVEAAASPPPTT